MWVGLWVGVFGVTSDNSFEKNGRPVGTRTPDLYRVKAASLWTSNNLEGVGERVSTRRHDEDELLTGEITGEECRRANSPA